MVCDRSKKSQIRFPSVVMSLWAHQQRHFYSADLPKMWVVIRRGERAEEHLPPLHSCSPVSSSPSPPGPSGHVTRNRHQCDSGLAPVWLQFGSSVHHLKHHSADGLQTRPSNCLWCHTAIQHGECASGFADACPECLVLQYATLWSHQLWTHWVPPYQRQYVQNESKGKFFYHLLCWECSVRASHMHVGIFSKLGKQKKALF